MQDTAILVIADSELSLLQAFTEGYISALVAHDKAYEGLDEFYCFNNKWDINIHSVGQKPRTIYAVAYPQTLDAEGYMSTDTSHWVEVGQYDMNGTPKKKATAKLERVVQDFWEGKWGHTANANRLNDV